MTRSQMPGDLLVILGGTVFPAADVRLTDPQATLERTLSLFYTNAHDSRAAYQYDVSG